MDKIQIELSNNSPSKNPRPGRQTTIFERTLRHLIKKNKHPGRIVPLYIDIDNDYKVLGAFTFNTGGSISFFPDVHGFDKFDHLTLNEDFLHKRAHYTSVSIDNEHKKVLEFDAPLLDNGDYHLITICIEDGDLFMDVFPSIKLPEIPISEYDVSKYLRILKEAIENTAGRIMFPQTEGIYCVQILITPKEKKEEGIMIYTKPIEDFLVDPVDLSAPIYARKLNILISDKSDFYLSIIGFRIQGSITEKVLFIVGSNSFSPAK